MGHELQIALLGPPREEDKAQKAPVTPRPVASIDFQNVVFILSGIQDL